MTNFLKKLFPISKITSVSPVNVIMDKQGQLQGYEVVVTTVVNGKTKVNKSFFDINSEQYYILYKNPENAAREYYQEMRKKMLVQQAQARLNSARATQIGDRVRG